MAEAIWYFADGDEERGPVTEAQIRALIGTGNLKQDDLVWKEGMDDWMPARDVPGLFQPAAAKKGESDSPAEEPSPSATPPAGASLGTGSSTAVTSPRPRALPPRPALDPTKPVAVFKWAAFLGQPLLLAGLLLVLLTRGCDSLGDRYVERVVAKAKVVEAQFQDEWNARKARLDKKRGEYEAEGASGREALAQVDQELSQLEADRQSEEAQLREGKWKDLANAARDAEATRDMWRFWREGFFWFAMTLLTLGLTIVSFTGQSTERWLSIILLAIVMYAVLVSV